jgi:hypothetical protein
VRRLRESVRNRHARTSRPDVALPLLPGRDPCPIPDPLDSRLHGPRNLHSIEGGEIVKDKIRGTGIAIVLSALSLAAVACATTPKAYVLRHPTHERCKPHYARVVKRAKGRRRVWCLYRRPSAPSAPTPQPTTPLAPSAPTAQPTPGLAPTRTIVVVAGESFPTEHYSVEGTILSGTTRLTGVAIKYTITDARTGTVVGSFVGLSNASGCAVAIRFTANSTVRTYTGEPMLGKPGCALPTVSMPVTDDGQISGSFAGNETYAPSVSAQAFF